MNIQIFTKPKSFDSKKAERYFKERGIKAQIVDLSQKGLSRGEYESIKKAAGGFRAMIDTKSREYETQFIAYLSEDSAIEEKLLAYPTLLRAPIVRNGRQATIGYQPEIWRTWE